MEKDPDNGCACCEKDKQIKLHLHKFILVNASSVFKSTLTGNFLEKDTKELTIKETCPRAMRIFMYNVYALKCGTGFGFNMPHEITPEIYPAILQLANKYDVGGILNACLFYSRKPQHLIPSLQALLDNNLAGCYTKNVGLVVRFLQDGVYNHEQCGTDQTKG